MFKINLKKENKNRGFTLVEMLVAVSIFAIVVMISLGAILTVLDANRKARTLTEVMNNLNFSVEMITRSLKTGVEPYYSFTDGGTLNVGAIILDESGFQREKTSYKFVPGPVGGKGYIARCSKVIGNYSSLQDYYDDDCATDDWLPITSDMVDIERFDVIVAGISDGNQPRTQIFISGKVQISERISSDFSLQTTVSQRRLNLVGSELDIGS